VISKKNVDVLLSKLREEKQLKNEKDAFTEDDPEESETLKRSRETLEKKARLYEKKLQEAISKQTQPRHQDELEDEQEDEDERELIDFQQKIAQEALIRRQRIIVEANDDIHDQKNVSQSNESDGEYITYVDNFGRTRRCLKNDLPDLYKQDSEVKPRAPAPVNFVKESDQDDEQEKESLQATHYQNVHFGEIRDHGPGYYAFDEEEEKRKEQMKLLNQLRQDTLKQREAREKLKERRKHMMKERLAKIAQRKGIELKQESSEDEDSAMGPQPFEEDDNISSRLGKAHKIREWDSGKEGVPKSAEVMFQDDELRKFEEERDKKRLKINDKEYMTQRRSEREAEFAPPSTYFSKPHNSKSYEQASSSRQKSSKWSQEAAPQATTSLPDLNEISAGLAFFKQMSRKAKDH